MCATRTRVQVVGRLRENPPVEGREVKGLLVRQGAEDLIMAAADLPSFTKLHTGRILQRQAILITQPFAKVSDKDYSDEGAGGFTHHTYQA